MQELALHFDHPTDCLFNLVWPGDCSLADNGADDGANFEEQVVGGLSLSASFIAWVFIIASECHA